MVFPREINYSPHHLAHFSLLPLSSHNRPVLARRTGRFRAHRRLHGGSDQRIQRRSVQDGSPCPPPGARPHREALRPRSDREARRPSRAHPLPPAEGRVRSGARW